MQSAVGTRTYVRGQSLRAGYYVPHHYAPMATHHHKTNHMSAQRRYALQKASEAYKKERQKEEERAEAIRKRGWQCTHQPELRKDPMLCKTDKWSKKCPIACREFLQLAARFENELNDFEVRAKRIEALVMHTPPQIAFVGDPVHKVFASSSKNYTDYPKTLCIDSDRKKFKANESGVVVS